MTTFQRVLAGGAWTTSYPDVLAENGGGKWVSRRGYGEAFRTLHQAGFALPWESQVHWSRFWSHYIGDPKSIYALKADAAFDRVVPFAWTPQASLGHAGVSSTEICVFLYPSAISVTVVVELTGSWALSDLATAVSGIWNAKDWTFTLGASTSSKRSLGGVATDLREHAVKQRWLGPLSDVGSETVQTVTAPADASGAPAELDLSDATAAACVAGLAALGPPGTLYEDHLIKESTNANRGARVYAIDDGHVIWHPERMLNPLPEKDPIKCLHRNQLDLVAHVAALGELVAWADERLSSGGVPVDAQTLARNAAERLKLLHDGNRRKTYRAGLAARRVEPVRAAADAVFAAL
jgi:hypothetical protein